jgi:hypothetical protein
MRTAILLVAVVSLAGCHKSYKSGFKKLGSNVAKVGHGVARIAKKAVPVSVDVDVDAKTQADLAALARHTAQQRVAQVEPITLRKSVKHVDRGPDPEPVQTVEPTITRTTVSTGADQVWRNTWRDGEKASCEKVADFDSCQTTCGDHMRAQSMRQLDPKAGKPVLCECTQGYSKCS